MTKGRDRYGAFAAAGLSGIPGAQAAVAAEVAKDQLGIRIRLLGGSDVDVEEALALVRAKLESSVESPAARSIEDVCDEVLRPWMTGEKRPAPSVKEASAGPGEAST